MTVMIERVAQAIAKEMGYRDPDTVEFAARAAIAAMREPTREMLNAQAVLSTSFARSVWLAMIDGALEEK
jgi:hypothetical protein